VLIGILDVFLGCPELFFDLGLGRLADLGGGLGRLGSAAELLLEAFLAIHPSMLIILS